MKKLSRLIPFLLAIAVLLIFSFQSVDGTMELSEGLRVHIENIYQKLGLSATGWWNDPTHFRKIGHVAEFAVVGMGVYLAIKNILYSIEVCAGLSIIDQLIKIPMPVRYFDWTDIPFDFIGYIIGILITAFLAYVVRCICHKRNKNS